MKIYVATSWRNNHHQGVVNHLRHTGHEVYDFTQPIPGDNGFHWSEIDPNWKQWREHEYVEALKHPVAEYGYGNDYDAMQWADACVLVLPSGRSSHLEAGWFVGAGKPLLILLAERIEPELMYKMADSVHGYLGPLADRLRAIESAG